MFSQASVSHSVHSEVGVGMSSRAGSHPLGLYSPPDTWTWDTTGYVSQAGCTHPIGILSCVPYRFPRRTSRHRIPMAWHRNTDIFCVASD